MKSYLIIAASFFMALSFNAMAADPVHGVWQSEKNEKGAYIDVEVTNCGSTICGKQIAAYNAENSSGNGKYIIEKMKNLSKNNYGGGTIYAPDSKKTYVAKMKLLSANKLEVKGCLSRLKIACRGQIWTRK